MNKLIENDYISAACNCTPQCADWGKNNLICYGSCHAVFIYNLNYGGGKIINVLTKHSKRVNSVRWIKGKGPETELVSGSSDGLAIVWSLQNEKYVPHVLKGHENDVTYVDGLYKNDVTVVITASMDSTIKIWFRKDSEDFCLSQSIDLDDNIALAVKCVALPDTDMLIACTLDNSSIRLYSLDVDSVKCNYIETLKGHEDWVRGLDFFTEKTGDILLASASQDCFVRLWRFSKNSSITVNDNTIMIYKKFQVNNDKYTISLIGILTGHEGWVYSVNWSPDGKKLLTASIDKTMIIWENNPKTNMWLENVRVGEVGGNTLGFYGGMFGPDGTSILAHSYHGAFHIWNCNNENMLWEPKVTLGGHFGEVVDLSWEPNGAFIMSVSSDQTTRIHAPWVNKGTDIITWHEIARPQVHGYDMSSLALLSRYKFVSSAEEKVIRAFQAPINFRDNFIQLCDIEDEKDNCVAELKMSAKGASVPSLGLSNKAVYENDNTDQAKVKGKEIYPEESYFTAIDLTEPPTEETLIQNTLWPEIQKLYGHGYEVYCLAANSTGSLIASACKSTSLEHSAVLLWDTSNWKNIQKLQSHTLTVVQLAFSPDSKHLLSVSRDRRWSLFTLNPLTNMYDLAATTNKSTGIHTRIIWCCGWSHDSKYFSTGSRDGKIVVWHKSPEKEAKDNLGQYEAASVTLDLKGQSVTALCFAPNLVNDQYLIAIGLESGEIHLYKWFKQWSHISVLDKSVAHHLAVKRLLFRPTFGKAGDNSRNKDILQLASCSSDHSLRVYNITYKNL